MARVEVTTCIEVDLGEVKDEDLMDEVRRRGLLNGRPSFSDGISDFLGGLGYKGAVTTEFAKKEISEYIDRNYNKTIWV